MLNSCIGVSDYNEQYSLCQPLLPSPLSTLGLTRSTQRHTTPLHVGLTHAVAVTDLEGTGKTQLVLRYIEEHEREYDAVLWIDVWSEETARSSYERCCLALGLPVEAPLRRWTAAGFAYCASIVIVAAG